MRNLLFAITLVGLVALNGRAEDAKDKKDAVKEKPGITLKVGDPAPALKASKWLQGQEVKEFQSGKVYVVEFWATWCGPCIVMMPHMAEMQADFRDKGVTFIGYSAKDPNNSEEKVTEFVKKRGPKLKYTFAYADDRDSYNAWMRAAGRGGIPCSFVVDKAGKIAYIGHPMYLDVVLPKVVDGSWKGKASLEEVDKIEKETMAVFTALRGDPEAALKAITEFETKYPPLAHIPYFLSPKLNVMLKAKKTNEVKKLAESVVDKAVKYDDQIALRTVSSVLRSGEAKDNKDLEAIADKAAEALKKLTEK
jgi:thiol-disulfide isomerase/thioredoxin